MKRFFLLLALCVAPLSAHAAPRHHHRALPPAPVTVGIVAFNDFHGQLEPPHQAVLAPDGQGGVAQVPAGGAAWFAGTVEAIRAKYRNHLTVAAGDMTSASQLSSALFLDEPTVGVMNRLGVDFTAIGNHEFDRGRDELVRLQTGGCVRHTGAQPCALERFAGAKYRYLAANAIDVKTGRTLFPASAIRWFGAGRARVGIGVIGLALRDVPTMVNAQGIAGLTFADEADTINAETAKLKAAGADAVIVLIHQGGRTSEPDPNGCKGLTGAIRPIMDRLDRNVDLVISGHTHWDYVCDYPAASGARSVLLTSAGHYGEEVTDIALTIDPAHHRVVSAKAHNVIVQSVPFTSARGPVALNPAFPISKPDPAIAAYVARYVSAVAPRIARVVGHLSGPAPRGADGGPLGYLIADSQMDATGADLALTNPFGIRADLVPDAAGAVSFGALYAVQPFGNRLVTETLTGADLKVVLEQGFARTSSPEALTPSRGFAYTVDMTQPEGRRVTAMTLNGAPIDPARRYRVTASEFLANGGDGFTALSGKGDAAIGPVELDALERWIAAAPVRQVPAETRVTMAH